MKCRLRSLLLCPALVVISSLRATEMTWQGLHFEYTGQTEYTNPYDGRSPKMSVRITNPTTTDSPAIVFSVAAVGLGNYPDPLDSGGFATFPNGGVIALAPGETTVASCWTGGVYEDRFGNTPPALGTSKDYTFDFIFSLRDGAPPGQLGESARLTETVRFSFRDEMTLEDGPLAVSARIIAPIPLPGGVLVEATTSLSGGFPLGTVTSDAASGEFLFSRNLPDRSDWYLRFSAEGMASELLPVGDGSSELLVTLEPLAPLQLTYELRQAIETPTGFWKGAVSETEGTFVAFPGQENWNRGNSDAEAAAIVQAGRVVKYTFDGTKLWEHAPDWEIWGGDMTPDGRYVAYVLNPSSQPYFIQNEFKMVLLDGLTGNVLREFTGPGNEPVGKRLESLELALSPNGQWIAVGSQASGQVTLFNRETGTTAWSVPGETTVDFGQVRKLLFSSDGRYLYCGSGDNYLRKLDVDDGSVMWRTLIGGWPFVNGMSFSPDESLIVTGTKSFDISVVRASDGKLMWTRESGSLDATFSPDGRHVATFTGKVYDATSGDLVGAMSNLAAARFTPDGHFFFKIDREVTVHELSGRELYRSAPTGIGINGGEQAQWAYVTRDGRYAIALGRDMANPPQTGIAIFERGLAGATAPETTSTGSAQSIAAGESLPLSAAAAGDGPLTYYWYRNGNYVAHSEIPALLLTDLTADDAGTYMMTAASPYGIASTTTLDLSVTAAETASHISNLSIRTGAGSGAQTLVVGFVVGGNGTHGGKPLLVRAVGPTLSGFGVGGVLADPTLQLFAGSAVAAANDNWGNDTTISALSMQLGAFALPADSLDAALHLSDLAAGAYTAQITGQSDGTGIVLAEAYDATPTAQFSTTTPRLRNISARAEVGSGEGVLVAGFVIAGESAKTVLVRAIGPTLGDFGVPGSLADPRLSIQTFDAVLAENDDWGADPAESALLSQAFSQVGAFALDPDSKDAAILITLPPGTYTAQVNGTGGSTGVALVEAYELND